MTREEFEALLEEAFEAGYSDAVEEIFDEDTDYESPYEDLYAYDESSKNVRKQMDKLNFNKNIIDDKRAIYLSGKATKDEYDTPHPNAINKGRNWIPLTRSNGSRGVYFVDDNNGNSNTAYVVKRRDVWGRSSNPRGRIKTSYPDTTDDPRSERLKKVIERNRARVAGKASREAAKKYRDQANKPGIFKNKGNTYE